MAKATASGRPSDPMTIVAIKDIGSAKRLVVKIGSALLVEDGAPAMDRLTSLAQDIMSLREQGSVKPGNAVTRNPAIRTLMFEEAITGHVEAMIAGGGP